MSALALAVRGNAPKGSSTPRVAPPEPVRSQLTEYDAAAKSLGIKPMAWQRIAARYMTALEAGARKDPMWRYREVCVVAARQNGKTELLLPLVKMRLRAGRRIIHTAQNRSLPRETFLRLAVDLNGDPDVVEIRYANGQEVIKMANGGRYTLVAPRPGARGNAVDDVILDEVREHRSFDLIGAIKPTMTASRNPQIIYLSNAGDDGSVVLNDLRRRAETDPKLAYLEWSAAPSRDLDDVAGWTEANPALGTTITLDTLADARRSLPEAVFETEHLCRWVSSMQPRLVSMAAWEATKGRLEAPLRPTLGLNMDPSGTRASGVIAWPQSDGTVAVKVIADVTGEPIDLERFGPELRDLAIKLGVTVVVHDPFSADLARYFRDPKAMTGTTYANACERFVRLIESGKLRWADAESIGSDLEYVGRKAFARGNWIAVRTNEERPVTSALAAIYATWVASEPHPAAPRIF